MTELPETVARRTVGEWALQSKHPYENTFTSVTVDGTFTGPSGSAYTIPGFYDGEGIWRVRFSPRCHPAAARSYTSALQ